MLLIGGVVAALAVFLFISKPKEELQAENDDGLQAMMGENTEKSFEMEEQEGTFGPLFVDVKGAVSSPGLYEAKEGDRILDAIEQAGGLIKTADAKQVNFAQKIHDEMVIYVPEKGEVVDEVLPVMSDHSSSQTEGKININRADLSELQTLSGVGPAKAQAIIDYREEQGPFKRVEDIQNVSGIGEKTFEKLQESITVN
ncbi:helix-hairpin-helix domain-containing protein [Bacillus norwichensis]|uniref:Helix-hairpin-helix domain-containing protein n=1 Tax=Bacillus norwichensis TaxID=2762217 RepID=A0ABR8VGV8_9BACI|nr:helix-hairpin-helix domain-containing protein [Bacillus norwichensis]MBD8003636.1 helix-hairpin-helix domain-containing protein [Bacillus norwichensis]